MCAFADNRFRGKHTVFTSAELRMQVMRLVMMGFPMDAEAAPFVDGGQVFRDLDFDGEFNINLGFNCQVQFLI